VPKVLTDEQVLQYRANGYLFLLDALNGNEVVALQSQLAATESQLGGALMAVDPKYRHNLHLLCPWMDTLVREPCIVDVIEDLLGSDILLYTSRFFIKGPVTEAFAAWHQDCTYFGLRPFDHVTAWVALSDVPLESGPVEFASGSHIRGPLNQRSKMVEGSVNTAGQFSLHHTCSVHQSGANKAAHNRIGVALSIIPTRVRTIGSVRMGATLIRGQDSYRHLDQVLPPKTDFGSAERDRHHTSFKKYLENFNEQLALHELNLPAT
jgi:hypothetical protein